MGDMRGRNVPLEERGKRKEGCVRREKEELTEGMQMALALGKPGNTRSCGVKGSSVGVTLPALFRPETGNWIHRRFSRWASSRFRPRPMQGEVEEAERKGERQRGRREKRKDDCAMSAPRNQESVFSWKQR